MALVVFLRGVNVGGHKTFRPGLLAKQLKAFDVVNIGAAGTFVVRKPGSQAAFTAALRQKLPVETHVVVCDGRELLRIESENPFDEAPSGTVRFVSILARASRLPEFVPLELPSSEDWLVRLIARDKRFVFGEYRRHVKTIGYLGQIDRLFGETATTRNWNTIQAIVRILKSYPGS